MNTKTEAPVISAELQNYVDTLYEYNRAVQDLNTGFGGATDYATTYDFGNDITESVFRVIAKNAEFVKERQAHIEKVERLAKELAAYAEAGLARDYVDYKQALYEYKKAENQL